MSQSVAVRTRVLVLLILLCAIEPFGAFRVSVALGQAAPAAPQSPALTPGNAAAESDRPEQNEPVIPPGQEELLATMLGKGESLPGPCTLTDGAVDRTVVRGTYKCPAGEVVVELRHPSTAPSAAASTDRFAITVVSGSAPPGLQTEIVSRIRSREAGFEWKWLGGPPARSSHAIVLLIIGAAVFVGVALVVALRRR